MRKPIYILLLLSLAGGAFGMGGAPVFTVGPKMTGMAVEAIHTVMELNSPNSTADDEKFSSDRVMLTARYGVLPSAEFSVQIGAANLKFGDMPPNFTEFDANWGLAWGGDIRVGFPTQPSPYQVVGALKYFGFRPSGTTSNADKTIETRYLWHEIAPTVTAGYAFGAITPYVGLAKPYLFGDKDVTVKFKGDEFPAAGGKESFSDGKQSVRGLLGLEWRGPDGYAISGEAAAAAGGLWTFSIGISQVLK